MRQPHLKTSTDITDTLCGSQTCAGNWLGKVEEGRRTGQLGTAIVSGTNRERSAKLFSSNPISHEVNIFTQLFMTYYM